MIKIAETINNKQKKKRYERVTFVTTTVFIVKTIVYLQESAFVEVSEQ